MIAADKVEQQVTVACPCGARDPAPSRAAALTGYRPLKQRIEQPERFLAEGPDIRIIEVTVALADRSHDSHQCLIFQRFGLGAAAQTYGEPWVNVGRRHRSRPAVDLDEKSGKLHGSIAPWGSDLLETTRQRFVIFPPTTGCFIPTADHTVILRKMCIGHCRENLTTFRFRVGKPRNIAGLAVADRQ